jgi:hypothetical protein
MLNGGADKAAAVYAELWPRSASLRPLRAKHVIRERSSC